MENELIFGPLAASLPIKWLVEALKQAFLPTRFALLVSVLLGALLGVIWATVNRFAPVDAFLSAVMGILSGGVASGDFAMFKALNTKPQE